MSYTINTETLTESYNVHILFPQALGYTVPIKAQGKKSQVCTLQTALVQARVYNGDNRGGLE